MKPNNNNSNYNKEIITPTIIDQDNELTSIKKVTQFNLIKEKNNLTINRKKLEKKLFAFWVLISLFSISFYIKYSLSKISKSKLPKNYFYDDNKDIIHIPEQYKYKIEPKENTIIKLKII